MKNIVDSTVNLTAYEGVEDLAGFNEPATVQAYRDERLDFVQPAVDFIRDKFFRNQPLDILDIGSGSGCLLFGLNRAGVLKHGVGVEVAASRWAFAQKWKEDLGTSRVDFLHMDIRDLEMTERQFDLCTIVDNTFAYLYPIDAAAPGTVLTLVHSLLREGGALILDLSIFSPLLPKFAFGDEYTEWSSSAPESRFRYLLNRNRLYRELGVVMTESRYLYRDSGKEWVKVECSKIYSLESVSSLLLCHGFKVIEWYEDFSQRRYIPEESINLVMIATTENGT